MKSDFGNEYMPKRATRGSAGLDMKYPGRVLNDDGTIAESKSLLCVPGPTYRIDTGIHLEAGDIKSSECVIIMPRSSFGFKYGFAFSNTLPLVDRDFTESIKLSFTVERTMLLKDGDRMCQMVVIPFGTIAGEIPPTAERNGGIGSTGVER